MGIHKKSTRNRDVCSMTISSLFSLNFPHATTLKTRCNVQPSVYLSYWRSASKRIRPEGIIVTAHSSYLNAVIVVSCCSLCCAASKRPHQRGCKRMVSTVQTVTKNCLCRSKERGFNFAGTQILLSYSTSINFRSNARSESNCSMARQVGGCICRIGDSSLASVQCRNTIFRCATKITDHVIFRAKRRNIFLQYRHHPWVLQHRWCGNTQYSIINNQLHARKIRKKCRNKTII